MAFNRTCLVATPTYGCRESIYIPEFLAWTIQYVGTGYYIIASSWSWIETLYVHLCICHAGITAAAGYHVVATGGHAGMRRSPGGAWETEKSSTAVRKRSMLKVKQRTCGCSPHEHRSPNPGRVACF